MYYNESINKGNKRRNEKGFLSSNFSCSRRRGYWVTFPDILECTTEGDDMEEAYQMAVDALGLALTERMKEGEKLPEVLKVEDIKEDGKIVPISL